MRESKTTKCVCEKKKKMSTKYASAVKSVKELYDGTVTNWNFQYMAAKSAPEKGSEYVLVLHVTVDEKDGDEEEKERTNGDYDDVAPLVNLTAFPENYETAEETKEFDENRHFRDPGWRDLLRTEPSAIHIAQIPLKEWCKSDKSEIRQVKKEVLDTSVEHLSRLKSLLNSASAIFAYDADICYALLRRICSDETLAGWENEKAWRYPRQVRNE